MCPRRRISRPSGKRPGSGKSFLLGRLRATPRHRSPGPLPDFVICGCRYAFRLFTLNGVAAFRDAKKKSPIERKVSGDETSRRGHFVRGPRNSSKELGKRNAFRPRRPRGGGTPIEQETRQTPYLAEKEGRGRGGEATHFLGKPGRALGKGGNQSHDRRNSPEKSGRSDLQPVRIVEKKAAGQLASRRIFLRGQRLSLETESPCSLNKNRNPSIENQADELFRKRPTSRSDSTSASQAFLSPHTREHGSRKASCALRRSGDEPQDAPLGGSAGRPVAPHRLGWRVADGKVPCKRDTPSLRPEWSSRGWPRPPSPCPGFAGAGGRGGGATLLPRPVIGARAG